MGNVFKTEQTLFFSVGGKALGYSTGCKITTSTETGERVTKEASAGKWEEKYVKSFSESISADGVVLTGSNAEMPTYDQLKDLQLAGTPVEELILFEKVMVVKARLPGQYKGKYIITSLDLDAQAGEDAKYSVQLENCGKVEKNRRRLAGDSNRMTEYR